MRSPHHWQAAYSYVSKTSIMESIITRNAMRDRHYFEYLVRELSTGLCLWSALLGSGILRCTAWYEENHQVTQHNRDRQSVKRRLQPVRVGNHAEQRW